jgi:hypothetical protein
MSAILDERRKRYTGEEEKRTKPQATTGPSKSDDLHKLISSVNHHHCLYIFL